MIGRALLLLAMLVATSAAWAAGPPPMASVGVLTFGKKSACSGTLIAPDVVLTAAHCLLRDNGKMVRHEHVRFRTGAYPGHASHSFEARDVVVHPFFRAESKERPERLLHDAALVRLAEPVPAEVVLPLAVAPPDRAARTFIASYRGGGPSRARERFCPVLRAWRDLVSLSCKVRPGESGSPVLVARAGALEVVGIVSASTRDKRTEVALAADAKALVGPLRALLLP